MRAFEWVYGGREVPLSHGLDHLYVGKGFSYTRSVNVSVLFSCLSRSIWAGIILIGWAMTKPTNWHVPPAKTQVNLGIRPIWSEFSLSAWKTVRFLATHKADSEDSDQTGRTPRLIWVLAGRTCHSVGFVMRWLRFVWLCYCFCTNSFL